MVSQKGIAFILIEEAGVGYTADSASFDKRPEWKRCFGKDCQFKPVWRNPILCDRQSRTKLRYTDPYRGFSSESPAPEKNATAIPLLVNPEGDVFQQSLLSLSRPPRDRKELANLRHWTEIRVAKQEGTLAVASLPSVKMVII